METIPSVLFRWIHIASVVVLVGGAFYARYCAGSVAARYRRIVWITAVTIPVSGLYTLFTKDSLPPGYHIVFGIKMLFVLHILVVGLLATTPVMDEAKRLRLIGGLSLSGFATFLISAYLRGMSIG